MVGSIDSDAGAATLVSGCSGCSICSVVVVVVAVVDWTMGMAGPFVMASIGIAPDIVMAARSSSDLCDSYARSILCKMLSVLEMSLGRYSVTISPQHKRLSVNPYIEKIQKKAKKLSKRKGGDGAHGASHTVYKLANSCLTIRGVWGVDFLVQFCFVPVLNVILLVGYSDLFTSWSIHLGAQGVEKNRVLLFESSRVLLRMLIGGKGGGIEDDWRVMIELKVFCLIRAGMGSVSDMLTLSADTKVASKPHIVDQG